MRWFDKKGPPRKWITSIYYAVAAADFAMKQSGIDITPDLSERTACLLVLESEDFTVVERENIVFIPRAVHAKISPAFIPSKHYQFGGKPGFDPVWRKGSEFGAMYGLFVRRSCHWRCISDNSPPGLLDDVIAVVPKLGDYADGSWQVLLPCVRFPQETTNPLVRPALLTKIAMASSSEKVQEFLFLKNWDLPKQRGAKIIAKPRRIWNER